MGLHPDLPAADERERAPAGLFTERHFQRLALDRLYRLPLVLPPQRLAALWVMYQQVRCWIKEEGSDRYRSSSTPSFILHPRG